MALTIRLRGMFGLCTFGPYSLGRRGFVGFNVDLVLLGILFFSTRIFIKLFVYFVLREGSSFFSYSLMCS